MVLLVVSALLISSPALASESDHKVSLTSLHLTIIWLLRSVVFVFRTWVLPGSFLCCSIELYEV